MPTPDYVYDPDDWECTYAWQDRLDLAETFDLDFGEVRRAATLIEGPEKFAVKVVTERDEAGDPLDWETRWFDSEAEAKAAAGQP